MYDVEACYFLKVWWGFDLWLEAFEVCSFVILVFFSFFLFLYGISVFLLLVSCSWSSGLCGFFVERCLGIGLLLACSVN